MNSLPSLLRLRLLCRPMFLRFCPQNYQCPSSCLNICCYYSWFAQVTMIGRKICLHPYFQFKLVLRIVISFTLSLKIVFLRFHLARNQFRFSCTHCQFWDFSFTFCFSEARLPMYSSSLRKMSNDGSLEITAVISLKIRKKKNQKVKKKKSKISFLNDNCFLWRHSAWECI